MKTLVYLTSLVTVPLIAVGADYEKTFMDDDVPGIVYHYEFVGPKYGNPNTDVRLTRVDVTTIGQFAVKEPVSISPGVYAQSWGVTLREIGSGAFAACDLIKSVTLPGTIRMVHDGAFRGCHNLESVTSPITEASVSIGAHAFANCGKLQSVVFQDQIVSIGGGAFSNCVALSSVKLNSSIADIGAFAFCNCTRLKEVAFGDALSELGDHVFDGCSSLAKVSFSGVCPKVSHDVLNGSPATLNVVAVGDCFGWPYEANRWENRQFTYEGLTVYAPYPRTETGQQVHIAFGTNDPTVSVRYAKGVSSCNVANSIKYSGPFEVSGDVVLRVRKFINNQPVGEEKTVNYLGTKSSPHIEVTHKEYGVKLLSIRNDTPMPPQTRTYRTYDNELSIFSELDQTDAWPIEVTNNITVRAFATAQGMYNSYAVQKDIEFTVATPTIRVGDYSGKGYRVYLECSDAKATIRYTTDGSDPTEASGVYDGNLRLYESCTIKARAFRTKWNSSAVVSTEAEMKVLDKSALMVETPLPWTDLVEVSYGLLDTVEIPNANVYLVATIRDLDGNETATVSSGKKYILTPQSLQTGNHCFVWNVYDQWWRYYCNRVQLSVSLVAEISGKLRKLQTVVSDKTFEVKASIYDRVYSSTLFQTVEIPTKFKCVDDFSPDEVRLTIDGEECGSYTPGENVSHVPLHFGNNVYAITFYKDGLACSSPILRTVSVPQGVDLSGEYAGMNWTYNTGTGILRISGSGEMSAVSQFAQDGWFSYKSFVKVEIGEGITSIGNYAFYKCSNIQAVSLPTTLKKIGKYAFCQCANLKVDIPDGVEEIGDFAFSECSSIRKVTIPQSLKTIGSALFYKCENLSEVIIEDGCPGISDVEFAYCPLQKLRVGRSVSNIDPSAFINCSSAVVQFDGNAPTTIHPGSSINYTAFRNVSSSDWQIFVREGSLGWGSVPGKWMGISTAYLPTYTVTFDTGCQVEVDSLHIVVGDEMGTLPLPQRDGYDFVSWSYDDLTTATNRDRVEDDVVLHAVWMPIKYSIHYHGNGGAGEMAEMNCVYGQQYEISACGFVHSGYRFVGWGTEAAGTAVYEVGQLVENLSLISKEKINLYAIWELERIDNPVVEPGDGSVFVGESCEVAISCETTGATIYYRVGAAPKATDRFEYTQPFEISDTSVIYVFAKLGDLQSETVCVTLTKVDALTFPEAVDADGIVTFELGGDVAWKPIKTDKSKVGSACVQSGAIGDNQTSWFKANVQGPGIIRFWWKASCEEDALKDFDHLLFAIDGKEVARIDGTTDWVEVSVQVQVPGSHTLAWAYVKDEGYLEGNDCGWVDGIIWEPLGNEDPIPELEATADSLKVKAALEGSEDARLAANIDNATVYGKYREWAMKIGAGEVKASPYAWASFATDSPALLTKVPKDDELKVEEFKPSALPGSFDFTVSVKDVTIGDKASEENLKKLFGLEGAGVLEPSAFTTENVAIDFKVPQNGKLKFTATPAVGNAKAFYMKMRVK